MRTTLFLIPIILALLIPSKGNDVQITTIKNPVLPIQLGNAKIIYNKHTFIHYINIVPIIKQLENIQTYFNNINNHFIKIIDHPISYNGLVKSSLLRTEYLIKNIESKVQNLHPHIRNKRGLINIIGKTQKWLFGTLDADDGERYNHAIDELQQNQENIVKELNLQISLSKNLIDNYNKTIFTLSRNQQKLEQSINMVESAFDSEINNLNNFIIFQNILFHINLDCQNLINFVDNLEDAILFAKLNALHDSIISGSELKKMLDYLKDIYTEREIPNFKNILNYYQILGTQVSFSSSKIIFAIHVPIVKPQTYSFHHLFPVIQKSQMIVPKYPYMARANQEVQFEESDCPLLEDTYYCNEVFHPQDDCIIQVMDGLKANSCQILQIHLQEPIIEQITTEEILIIPHKKERILAQCKMDQYIDLEAPTLVKIPKECQIRIGIKTFTNDIKINHGKPLILPELYIANFTSNIKILKTQNLSKINFDEIYKLKDMANQLSPVQEVEDEPSQYPSIIIGILAICLLVIVVITIRRQTTIFKYFKKKPVPDPKPEEVALENTSRIF